MPQERQTRKKAKLTKAAPKLHHNVYVIELDKKVLTEARFVRANLNHDPGEACPYVGMTGLTPEERFKVHKDGGPKSNKHVEVYGLYLRHRMFQRFNPMTFEDAAKKEKELAEELRAKGHAVWQH